MTGYFKILDLMLQYVCFTMISTFNLTPSATGKTGRDGRVKLAGSTDSYDWSLVVILVGPEI